MKKNILLAAILPALLLSSCGNDEKPFEITFNDYYDKAYLYEEYDLTDAIRIDKNATYTITASYYDYKQDVMKDLEIEDDYYFTPIELFDIKVDIKATKGNYSDERILTIPVGVNGDPVDELLSTDGLSGWADPGVYKSLNIDPTYIKSEKSTSSLRVSYSGADEYRAGMTTLCLHNFRLTDIYSVGEDYSNAALRFWVYNPTEHDIEFQLRIKEQNFNDPDSNIVDIEWGNLIKVSRIAEPGEWTEIIFSLRHFGITRKLTETAMGDYRDAFIVKCRYLSPETSAYYSFNYYVDDLDVVDARECPSLTEEDTRDVNKKEKASESYENCYLDDGWISQSSVGLGDHAHVLYDSEKIRKAERASKSSVHLSFKNCIPGDGMGYFVAFNMASQAIDDGRKIAMNKGTLVADIKFEGITNTDVMVTGVRMYQSEWAFARKSYQTTDLADGWRRLTVDLSDPMFELFSEPQRLGLSFDGVDETNRDNAHIYIDNLLFLGQ